jgi:hypothetical protein
MRVVNEEAAPSTNADDLTSTDISTASAPAGLGLENFILVNSNGSDDEEFAISISTVQHAGLPLSISIPKIDLVLSGGARGGDDTAFSRLLVQEVLDMGSPIGKDISLKDDAGEWPRVTRDWFKYAMNGDEAVALGSFVSSFVEGESMRLRLSGQSKEKRLTVDLDFDQFSKESVASVVSALAPPTEDADGDVDAGDTDAVKGKAPFQIKRLSLQELLRDDVSIRGKITTMTEYHVPGIHVYGSLPPLRVTATDETMRTDDFMRVFDGDASLVAGTDGATLAQVSTSTIELGDVPASLTAPGTTAADKTGSNVQVTVNAVVNGQERMLEYLIYKNIGVAVGVTFDGSGVLTKMLSTAVKTGVYVVRKHPDATPPLSAAEKEKAREASSGAPGLAVEFTGETDTQTKTDHMGVTFYSIREEEEGKVDSDDATEGGKTDPGDCDGCFVVPSYTVDVDGKTGPLFSLTLPKVDLTGARSDVGDDPVHFKLLSLGLTQQQASNMGVLVNQLIGVVRLTATEDELDADIDLSMKSKSSEDDVDASSDAVATPKVDVHLRFSLRRLKQRVDQFKSAHPAATSDETSDDAVPALAMSDDVIDDAASVQCTDAEVANGVDVCANQSRPLSRQHVRLLQLEFDHLIRDSRHFSIGMHALLSSGRVQLRGPLPNVALGLFNATDAEVLRVALHSNLRIDDDEPSFADMSANADTWSSTLVAAMTMTSRAQLALLALGKQITDNGRRDDLSVSVTGVVIESAEQDTPVNRVMYHMLRQLNLPVVFTGKDGKPAAPKKKTSTDISTANALEVTMASDDTTLDISINYLLSLPFMRPVAGSRTLDQTVLSGAFIEVDTLALDLFQMLPTDDGKVDKPDKSNSYHVLHADMNKLAVSCGCIAIKFNAKIALGAEQAANWALATDESRDRYESVEYMAGLARDYIDGLIAVPLVLSGSIGSKTADEKDNVYVSAELSKRELMAFDDEGKDDALTTREDETEDDAGVHLTGFHLLGNGDQSQFGTTPPTPLAEQVIQQKAVIEIPCLVSGNSLCAQDVMQTRDEQLTTSTPISFRTDLELPFALPFPLRMSMPELRLKICCCSVLSSFLDLTIERIDYKQTKVDDDVKDEVNIFFSLISQPQVAKRALATLAGESKKPIAIFLSGDSEGTLLSKLFSESEFVVRLRKAAAASPGGDAGDRSLLALPPKHKPFLVEFVVSKSAADLLQLDGIVKFHNPSFHRLQYKNMELKIMWKGVEVAKMATEIDIVQGDNEIIFPLIIRAREDLDFCESLDEPAIRADPFCVISGLVKTLLVAQGTTDNVPIEVYLEWTNPYGVRARMHLPLTMFDFARDQFVVSREIGKVNKKLDLLRSYTINIGDSLKASLGGLVKGLFGGTYKLNARAAVEINNPAFFPVSTTRFKSDIVLRDYNGVPDGGGPPVIGATFPANDFYTLTKNVEWTTNVGPVLIPSEPPSIGRIDNIAVKVVMTKEGINRIYEEFMSHQRVCMCLNNGEMDIQVLAPGSQQPTIFTQIFNVNDISALSDGDCEMGAVEAGKKKVCVPSWQEGLSISSRGEPDGGDGIDVGVDVDAGAPLPDAKFVAADWHVSANAPPPAGSKRVIFTQMSAKVTDEDGFGLGTSDTQCYVTWMYLERITSEKKNDDEPNWGSETLDFGIGNLITQKTKHWHIVVKCYDIDVGGDDDLGSCNLNVKEECVANGECDMACKLLDKEGKKVGKFAFHITWHEICKQVGQKCSDDNAATRNDKCDENLVCRGEASADAWASTSADGRALQLLPQSSKSQTAALYYKQRVALSSNWRLRATVQFNGDAPDYFGIVWNRSPGGADAERTSLFYTPHQASVVFDLKEKKPTAFLSVPNYRTFRGTVRNLDKAFKAGSHTIELEYIRHLAKLYMYVDGELTYVQPNWNWEDQIGAEPATSVDANGDRPPPGTAWLGFIAKNTDSDSASTSLSNVQLSSSSVYLGNTLVVERHTVAGIVDELARFHVDTRDRCGYPKWEGGLGERFGVGKAPDTSALQEGGTTVWFYLTREGSDERIWARCVGSSTTGVYPFEFTAASVGEHTVFMRVPTDIFNVQFFAYGAEKSIKKHAKYVDVELDYVIVGRKPRRAVSLGR